MNKGGGEKKIGSEFLCSKTSINFFFNSRIHPTASNSDKKRPKKTLYILVDVLQIIADIIAGTMNDL